MVNGPVVVFDGECGLCRTSVQFILRHERQARLRFASQQSAAGRALLEEHGLRGDGQPAGPDSVFLLQDGRVFSESEAALRIARHLRFPWSLLGAARVLPRFLRDPLYRLVARNRRRFFSRGACALPSPETSSRFLG